MEYELHAFQRALHVSAIRHVSLEELGVIWDVRGLAAWVDAWL